MAAYPEEFFLSYPSVCAAGNEYQILVPVRKRTVMWCEVGGKMFYDDCNGFLRCRTEVHKIIVPAALLDAAKQYTIHYREILAEKPHSTLAGEERTAAYSFRPVGKQADCVRMYHLADTHNTVNPPIKAGSYWGDKLDLLIVNGDGPDSCGAMQDILSVFLVSGELTKGEIPMIFSRGNHDMWGLYSETFASFMPMKNGKTYYTFRLGPVWGLVLDTGEDKHDDHEEFGHIACSHDFRLRETEFLKAVAADPEHEYNAPGVRFRMVIAHNPFTRTFPFPYNIDEEILTEWCRILKSSIHPHVIVCGHCHKSYIVRPGDPMDQKGQPCPVIVASEIDERYDHHAGAALEWTPGKLKVLFTDEKHQVFMQDELNA